MSQVESFNTHKLSSGKIKYNGDNKTRSFQVNIHLALNAIHQTVSMFFSFFLIFHNNIDCKDS